MQNWEKKLCSEGLALCELVNFIVSPLVATYHPESRKRVFPPETVVTTYLYGVLSGDKSLRQAVIHNNAERALQGLAPSSLSTAALAEARKNLHIDVVRGSARGFASETQKQMAPQDFWGGMVPYAIDGTTLTANDTPENQDKFPQHSNQDSGAGFPLIRLLVLQSLQSGMVYDCAFDAFQGKETGEMALARQVLGHLGANDLLIGDSYFPSFFLMADLISQGAHGVFQSHGARDVDFRRGTKLGKKDHALEWMKPQRPSWMSHEIYDSYPPSLKLREVDVRHEAGEKTPFVLVTTLLDAKAFTKPRLASFYKKRWQIELALRDLKTTFHMEHIAANTPEMVEKGIWSHMLAYNILRWHMYNAAALCEVPMENISVKASARVITENGQLFMTCTEETKMLVLATVYSQMVQAKVGNRPGRREPRAIKRRPKPRERLNEKRSAWRARQSP